jgi:hypothetical protein
MPEKEFGTELTSADLVNVPNHHGYVKMIDGKVRGCLVQQYERSEVPSSVPFCSASEIVLSWRDGISRNIAGFSTIRIISQMQSTIYKD